MTSGLNDAGLSRQVGQSLNNKPRSPKVDFGASGIFYLKRHMFAKRTMSFINGKKSLTPYPKITLWPA
jgi:hypothetical protein